MPLYTEQFETYNDFPCQDTVKQYYLICFTPRCGSHLLGHSLFKTDQLGFPLEYFAPKNFTRWRRRFGTNGIKDTYEMIKRYRTSPNGYFGCKLHFGMFNLLFREYKIDELFPKAKFIYIRRKDLLGQAVSLAKARKTGSWISAQKPVRLANYSFAAIERALKDIVRDNARWEYLFSRRGWPYFGLYYEDFLKNPAEIIEEIALFLGVELKSDFNFKFDQLPKKQGDNINQKFRENYLLEARDTKLDEELMYLQEIESLSTRRIGSYFLTRIKNKAMKLLNRVSLKFFSR